jgi:hypothetical protein
MIARALFPSYQTVLANFGASAVLHPSTSLDEDTKYRLFYIPFEHVNKSARLVIVGITPGLTQLQKAYDAIKVGTRAGLTPDALLADAKRIGAFGGPSMRPNLVRLINETGISRALGIIDANELWDDRSDLLHATSVVPHAAFHNSGKMFNGSFDEVLNSRALRTSFESDFVPTLSDIRPGAMYIGLGPTPRAALDWCVKRGYIASHQVLGSFPHPSTNSGSQVAIYLGEKPFEYLKPKDPVRHRTYLVDWARELRACVQTRLAITGNAV